jgi:hypothetical protein
VEGANFMSDLWLAAKTAGPFATMLMLLIWYKTDRERLKLQTERDALLERVLNTMDKVAGAMEAAQQITERRK